MGIHRLTVAGSGRVTVPAYGLADAEHRVEKEIAERLPGCSVAIVAVERPPGQSRIVEEFLVEYRVSVEVRVDAEDRAAARTAAFRNARSGLDGSRYLRTVWDTPPPESADGPEAV